jgi:hypothetical protein
MGTRQVALRGGTMDYTKPAIFSYAISSFCPTMLTACGDAPGSLAIWPDDLARRGKVRCSLASIRIGKRSGRHRLCPLRPESSPKSAPFA